jgi:exodeoxyribonuclease VII small subunit
MPKKKELTFEQSLNRLMEITERLESGETGLEDSMVLYKEGITLSKSCGENLGRFEAEVLLLQKEAEGVFNTPVFDSP